MRGSAKESADRKAILPSKLGVPFCRFNRTLTLYIRSTRFSGFGSVVPFNGFFGFPLLFWNQFCSDKAFSDCMKLFFRFPVKVDITLSFLLITAYFHADQRENFTEMDEKQNIVLTGILRRINTAKSFYLFMQGA